MVEEKEPERVIDPQNMIFMPPIGSSSSRPMIRDDLVELMGDANFARLEEIAPNIAAEVYRFWEIRRREVVQSDEAALSEWEHDAELNDLEDIFRPQMPAVKEANHWERLPFNVATYELSRPHMIVPSGFDPIEPKRTFYDDNVVRWDPETHLSRSWAEV